MGHLAGNAEGFKATLMGFLTKPVAPQTIEKFGTEAAKATRAALDKTLGTLIETSFADQAKLMTTPTLIVGGIHDALFSPDVLRAWFASLTSCRFAFLDSNHEIPIEQPRELAALLEAFLAGIEPIRKFP